MSIHFPGAPDVSSAALRRLADDLDRIARDGGPTPDDLSRAPILHHWRTIMRQHAVLIGLVEGHPVLGSGRPIVTSGVVFADADAGWARSMSRFYRLGDELPPLPSDLSPVGVWRQ